MEAAQLIDQPNTGVLVELDCRENSDEKVQLFWQPVTKRTYIRLTTASDVSTRQVPNEEARHAFMHPYVYID